MAVPRARRPSRSEHSAPARRPVASRSRRTPARSDHDDPDPTGDVLWRADPDARADVLRRADAGTRARAAIRFQRAFGNSYVRQIVQRAPAPVTDPSTAGPGQGTWLQPFPSTVPRIILPPTESYKSMYQLGTGHPYIDSLPTATPQDRALIQEANEFFESNPLHPGERASGDYLAKRNKVTNMFERKAYELTLYTLQQSFEQASSERFRYDEVNVPDNVEVRNFREAAYHLGKVQAALVDLANNPVARAHNKGQRVVEITTLDGYLTAPKLPPRTNIAEWGWAGAGEAVITKDDSVKSNAALDQLPAAMQQYKTLREVYAERFPVLLSHNQDYDKLANAPPGEIAKWANAQSTEVIKHIGKVHGMLTPEKIWSLPIVIGHTRQLLGIEEGTGASDAVEGKRLDVAWDKAIERLAMAALEIGLTIVSLALSGGGTAVLRVAGAVAGAAASGVAVKEEWEQYSFQKAMTGRVSLDSAKRLAEGEPGYGWLAFDIVSMVVDLAGVVSAFRHLARALKGVDALGDAAKAARTIGSLDDVAAMPSALSMKQVEDVVSAQARVLAQEGKLAPGLTEELFVERIMAGLRRQVANQGANAERQAGAVARVLDGTHPLTMSLRFGERDALTRLLIEHGEWKTLIMALERGGQPEIAKHLVRLRKTVIDEVTAEVKRISQVPSPKQPKAFDPVPADVKPMKGGSEELVSDVDLQVIGADAGQMMIEAEAYMARQFGAGWSEMFRMNFYTEGRRLTRYQEVLGELRPGARVGMTKRITVEVERYTFARMLQHAGDDPAAIARVESSAQAVGVDLNELRTLAALDEPTRAARRNALLQEIDALEAQYRTATGTRSTELAEQISTKQIEANFYTYEANIGPGSLARSGVGDLAKWEAYQSALTQLDMIEHILATTGGDVVRASREYELFKYIGRFGDAAAAGGDVSPRMRWVRNQAKAVADGQRNMMEETAHRYLDSSRVHDTLPQHAGSRPPVTDDYLIRSFEAFDAEARTVINRLKPKTAPRSAPGVGGGPGPGGGGIPARTNRTTAKIPAVRTGLDLTSHSDAPRLLNRSTPERYYMVDAENPKLHAVGHVYAGTTHLSLTIRTVSDGQRSKVLRGATEFRAILDHFEGKFDGILGAWSYGDNLAEFNKLTAGRKSLEEAALGTWTGQQSVAAGYAKVTVRSVIGTPGAYTKVDVLFHK